jgi:molybdopterin molybdotransferase
MVSIEDGLNLIYKNLQPVGTELVPIESSLSRVVARDVVAEYPLPNFDNSAMDGYGVSIIDVGKEVKIWKTIFAGDEVSEDEYLPKDSIVKIMTGAKVPKGVSTIIPFEDIPEENKSEDSIKLPNAIQPNRHIRRIGEDIEKGSLLIEKGSRLNAYSIGILASQGVSHIEVYRKPKVVIFATGKELKMHYETIESHQIFNTNSPMLVERSRELGAELSFLKISDDSKDAIKEAIKNSLHADLIVTSGGVSVGEADFTKESFFEMGMETLFEKVDIKPGKPTTFGTIGKTAVLNLPGNPSAGLINFELFGRASILQLSGDRNRRIKTVECEILEGLEVKAGKFSVILGYYDGAVFRPLKKRSPGMVTPLLESNGFIILHKSVSKLERESFVRFIPTKFHWASDFEEQLITQ